MKEDFDVDRIDDVIHGRLRLGIMAMLAASTAASFTELKTRLKTTDGNLSVQLRKLEAAGYVTLDKGFHRGRTLTTARLTQTGRDAFSAYLETIGMLVNTLG
jgi:DNA-binding MarR family transcriptional regulator